MPRAAAHGRAWNEMSFKVSSTVNYSMILNIILLAFPWLFVSGGIGTLQLVVVRWSMRRGDAEFTAPMVTEPAMLFWACSSCLGTAGTRTETHPATAGWAVPCPGHSQRDFSCHPCPGLCDVLWCTGKSAGTRGCFCVRGFKKAATSNTCSLINFKPCSLFC